MALTDRRKRVSGKVDLRTPLKRHRLGYDYNCLKRSHLCMRWLRIKYVFVLIWSGGVGELVERADLGRMVYGVASTPAG